MFDIYIQKMAEYIDEMRKKGRQVRIFDSPAGMGMAEEVFPVRVGPGASGGIILREDCFVELGSPEAGSCAFMIRTNDPYLISDGRTTLIGPDIGEATSRSLPFGQVVMMGGLELGDKDHEKLQQTQFISDQIEGYMVRTISRNLWSRVSKDVVKKNFCFQTLARALATIYKLGNSKIQTMETIFVTSSKEDVNLLDDIAAQVQKINKEIVKENWKIRGYDIECALDCSSCGDESVCDDIREVLKIRNKGQETDSQIATASRDGC